MTTKPAETLPAAGAVASARATLAAERDGLGALSDALSGPLGQAFERAVDVILAARGRVIVAGIGKSGHVGRKIAATLASTGTPAHFVHAAEASHGDLGMIVPDDVVLALSWSGETAELKPLVDYAVRFRVRLVAITSEPGSTLARAADPALVLPKAAEACPNGLAPTTSSTMQMVIGDALAVALLAARGFSARDFRVFHPGGRLGAQLTLVRDLMHTGAAVPRVAPGTDLVAAIGEITAKGFGCVFVVSGAGAVEGVLTDGDLRRALQRGAVAGTVDALMSVGPRAIAPDALAADALALMQAPPRPITVLAVVAEGRLEGLLHMHDLLRAGVA